MKIGITQRVELVKTYNEKRDCLDHRWFDIFEELNINAVPIPNNLKDPISFVKKNTLKGFIFTGGNDISSFENATNISKERDKTEIKILRHSRDKKLPVLGVCRGLQLINHFLNGKQKISNKHIGVKHNVKAIFDINLFQNYCHVNSYHSYVIPLEQLSSELDAILISDDKCVEAFKHKKLPWLGIMWHPERELPMNKIDLELIKAHFSDSS